MYVCVCVLRVLGCDVTSFFTVGLYQKSLKVITFNLHQELFQERANEGLFHFFIFELLKLLGNYIQ